MAYPDPKIVTVAAPTNQINPTRPRPTESARSTAPEQPYVVIPGGGQQPTSWPRARDTLQRLHVGLFTGPAGTFRQTTGPTDEARRLHTALDLPLPPRILHLDTEATATR